MDSATGLIVDVVTASLLLFLATPFLLAGALALRVTWMTLTGKLDANDK